MKTTMHDANDLKFFMYCRKSSEDDRQAASIGDQLRELSPLIERERLKLAAEPFREEKSAKAPGRPVFNEMLSRIERGEANAIICWDIDRLYRNPVDEGGVRWLLQQGVIREIRTPHRVFYPHDAGLLMGVEGGRATDHIITLRKGVFRGMRGKLEKGHRPGKAPAGYLNDSSKEQGERDIAPDPERFSLVRRAWDLMLTGRHSVREIQRFAAQGWALRSRKTKKRGGKPYSLSAWYQIFTDPFYYGWFWWREPGTDIRKLYRGAHAPMVSQGEFDRLQLLLGRKGKPVPQAHRFPFTGLLRCGNCHSMITAEEKHQIICPQCKLKFSSSNKDACPKCLLRICKMEYATRLHYTYYHCTKQKDRTCSQRSLRVEGLERQVDELLSKITISEEFKRWAIESLRREGELEGKSRRQIEQGLQQRHQELRRQIEHINLSILSPDTDWTLISREEVRERKLALGTELQRVEAQLATSRERARDSLELTERTFEFAAYARFWFREGNTEQKRAVLAALGSNLTLKDKTLELELQKPLRLIGDLIDVRPTLVRTLEPTRRRSNKRKSPINASGIPVLCRELNAIRTYWETTLEADAFPIFDFHRNTKIQENKTSKLAA